MINVYDFNYNDKSDLDSVISGFNDKTNDLIIMVKESIGNDDELDYQTHAFDNETILEFDPQDSIASERLETVGHSLIKDDKSILTTTSFNGFITDDQLILHANSVDPQKLNDAKKKPLKKLLSTRFDDENVLKLTKLKPIITRSLINLKKDLKSSESSNASEIDRSLKKLNQLSQLLIFISNYESGSRVNNISNVYESDLIHYSKVRHNDAKISYKSSLIQQFLVEIYHYINTFNLHNSEMTFSNDNDFKLVNLLTSFEKLAVTCDNWKEELKLPLPEKKTYEDIKNKIQAKQKETKKNKAKKDEGIFKSSGSVRSGNGTTPLMADTSPVKIKTHDNSANSSKNSPNASYEFPSPSASPTNSRRGSISSTNSTLKDSPPSKAKAQVEQASTRPTKPSSSSFLPKLTLISTGYDGMPMPNPAIAVQFPNYISLIKSRHSAKREKKSQNSPSVPSSPKKQPMSESLSRVSTNQSVSTTTTSSTAFTRRSTLSTLSTVSSTNTIYSYTPASTFSNGLSVFPLDIDNLRNLNRKLVELHTKSNIGNKLHPTLALNTGNIKVIERILNFINSHLLKSIIIPELIDFLTEYQGEVDSLISKLANHIN